VKHVKTTKDRAQPSVGKGQLELGLTETINHQSTMQGTSQESVKAERCKVLEIGYFSQCRNRVPRDCLSRDPQQTHKRQLQFKQFQQCDFRKRVENFIQKREANFKSVRDGCWSFKSVKEEGKTRCLRKSKMAERGANFKSIPVVVGCWLLESVCTSKREKKEKSVSRIRKCLSVKQNSNQYRWLLVVGHSSLYKQKREKGENCARNSETAEYGHGMFPPT
jgi:hypothetical protein